MRTSLLGLALGLGLASMHPACAAPRPGEGTALQTNGQPGGEVLFVRAERLIVRPGEVVEGGRVLIKDRRIVAVGRDVEKPAGARELDAKVVCAAYIDAWGAITISADARTETGATSATRAIDAFDPYDEEQLRREILRAGVTSVRVQAGTTARTGGVGALLRIAPGLSRDQAVLVAESNVAFSAGLSANAPGPQQTAEFVDGQIVMRESGSRAMDPFDRVNDIERITAALDSGRSYLLSKVEHKHELEEWQKKIAEKETQLDKDAKKAKKDREKEEKDAKEKGKKFEEKKYKEDKKPQAPKYDEDSEVLARAADGALPLIVQAHRTAELRSLLAGLKKFDRARLVVEGASEALAVASELAARGIPVLLTPALIGRNAPDELEAADLSLAARLQRAGVEVLIGSGGVDPAASRELPLLAELAIGNGLDRESAFEAITIGAARALDADARIGSVERGKDAELLLLDGDPLTPEGRVRYVISAGQVVVTPEG